MEPKHRTILRHHWSNIRQNLKPKNILPKLVTVLNETDEEEIKAQPIVQESCDKLLEILPRKGPEAFNVFVEALKEEAPHLASDLIESAGGSCNCCYCKDLRNQRDSARGEIRNLQKEINKLNNRIADMNGETKALEKKLEDERTTRGNLKLSIRKLDKEKKEQELTIRRLQSKKAKLEDANAQIKKEKDEQELKIKQLQRKNAELEKATVQTSEFEKESEKNNKKTKEEEDYHEQTETKVKTDLQAQVDELEDKLKNQSKRMSEQEKHFSEVIKAAKSKFDALEEELKRLDLRWKERPGRIHNYRADFDKRGVIYNFGTSKSSATGITATRSSDSKGEAKDILRNQMQRPKGIVCATKARENSWWCVDLTENYALYLTHYTLRHGQEQRGSVLRYWKLQGSFDGNKWTTLKNHENDQGLQDSTPYCTCTWKIEGDSNAFRYFRILQTRENSTGNLGIFLSGIELYGVLIEIGSQC